MASMYNVNQINLHGKLFKDIDIDTLTGMSTHVPSSKLLKQKLDQLGNQIKSEIEVYELTTISTDVFVAVPKHEGLYIKQGTWTVQDWTVSDQDYSYSSQDRTITGLMVKISSTYTNVKSTYEVPKKIYMRDVEWDVKIVALKADSWSSLTNIYAPDVSIFEKSDTEGDPVLLDTDTIDSKIHRLDITCADFEGTMDMRCGTDQSWRLILHGISNLDFQGFKSNYKGSLIVDSDKNVGIYRLSLCVRDVTLPTNNYCVGMNALSDAMTIKIPVGSRLSYDLNKLGAHNLRIDCYEPNYFIKIGPVIMQDGTVIYERPVDRFRLLNEEEHLMENIYRYKANALNDINFFRSCEGYEQTFKVKITPNASEHSFVYTQDTERTPSKVFLSNWLYDEQDREYKLIAYDTKTGVDVSYTTDETHTTFIMCRYQDNINGYMAFRSKPAGSGKPLYMDGDVIKECEPDAMSETYQWICVQTGATTDLELINGKDIMYTTDLTSAEKQMSVVTVTNAHEVKHATWDVIKAIAGAGIFVKTNAEDLFIIPIEKYNPADGYEVIYVDQKITYSDNKTVTFATAKEIKLSAQIEGLIVSASAQSTAVLICYPNLASFSHVVFPAVTGNELFITEKDLTEIDISSALSNVSILRLGYASVIKLLEKGQIIALGEKIGQTATVYVPAGYDIPKIKELLTLTAQQTIVPYEDRHDH